MAGLAAARSRGRSSGRPTVWTPAKPEVARSRYRGGEHDVATIARVVGVSRASLYRALEPQTSKVSRRPRRSSPGSTWTRRQVGSRWASMPNSGAPCRSTVRARPSRSRASCADTSTPPWVIDSLQHPAVRRAVAHEAAFDDLGPGDRGRCSPGAVGHLQGSRRRPSPRVVTVRRDATAQIRKTQGGANQHRTGSSAGGGRAGPVPDARPACCRNRDVPGRGIRPHSGSGRLPAALSDGGPQLVGISGRVPFFGPPKTAASVRVIPCRLSSWTRWLATWRPCRPRA
jgi:hypothetical protein